MAKKKGGPRHRTATRLVTGGRDIEAQQGFVNPPVYRGSTVLFPSLAELESDIDDRYNKVVYGRWGTPTHFALQSAVAELEGGHHAIAFGSGKAAILAALIAFLRRIAGLADLRGPGRSGDRPGRPRRGRRRDHGQHLGDAALLQALRPRRRRLDPGGDEIYRRPFGRDARARHGQ
jgi:hypothetical protein